MVSIYVVADKDGKIKSWGHQEYGFLTETAYENILVQLMEGDDFFNSSSSSYRLSGASLIKETALLFEYEKEKQIDSLSLKCQEYILSGFDFTLSGTSYHFSYDQEAQLNFQDTYNLFQNNLLEEISWTVRTEKEKKRIKLSKESFLTVYREAIKYKNESLNHLYDDLIKRVNDVTNPNDFQFIKWTPPETKLQFNMEDMLEQKLQEIDGIGKESEAQKSYNAYTESMMMEVVDILFMM